MTRVLLTGATGFVGRHVHRALIARGCKVRAVIRTGSTSRVSFDAEIVETDDLFVDAPELWAARCADIDMVLHLAWYAEPGKYLTSLRNLDCLGGTLALAKGALAAGVQRFVGTGTCFEYDLRQSHLFTDTPLDPLTPYASAKAATYLALKTVMEQEETSFLWARLFYLFGEGEDARRLVPYLHQQMRAGARADLTSGTQVRDFMDVKDAAEMLVEDALGTRSGASNIASSQGITVRALAERIADEYGRRDLLNFGARPDNLTDPPCVIGMRNAKDAP